jgi:hypothetical protein
LHVREKAHTREGDAIAAARRRLPMVEVDAATPLIGEHGKITLLDTFEDHRTYRLLLYVIHRPSCTRTMRRVHVAYFANMRTVLFTFTRCYLRCFLPGSLRGKCTVPRLYGLGAAMVLGFGFARNIVGRTPGGNVSHSLLPEAGIQGL